MRSKCINQKSPIVYALVFDKGEELLEGLTRFATEKVLSASGVTGIGAFSELTLGYFDRDLKDYKKIEMKEQVEVLCMTGDITIENGKPRAHVHVIVGKSDATAHGGHIIRAVVWPTLEVIVTEAPQYLCRRLDPETGLPLIDPCV